MYSVLIVQLKARRRPMLLWTYRTSPTKILQNNMRAEGELIGTESIESKSIRSRHKHYVPKRRKNIDDRLGENVRLLFTDAKQNH